MKFKVGDEVYDLFNMKFKNSKRGPNLIAKYEDIPNYWKAIRGTIYETINRIIQNRKSIKSK